MHRHYVVRSNGYEIIDISVTTAKLNEWFMILCLNVDFIFAWLFIILTDLSQHGDFFPGKGGGFEL